MKNVECSVCGGNKFVQRYRTALLCCKHRHQMVRHGKILNRTTRDKNEIKIKGNIAKIVLRNNQQVVVGEAIVDKNVVSKVKQTKWYLGQYGYALTGPQKKGSRLLHRMLFGKKGKQIDHINGNRLDNRRRNIRCVGPAENAYNRNHQKNNALGVKGVYFDKNRKKYSAEIKYKKKKYHLGRFATLEEAREAYVVAEKKLFGKFRRVKMQ